MTISGDYPCCGGLLFIWLPERTPQMLPELCPYCKTKVWHHLSRVDPWSLTHADFLQDWFIEHDKKNIRKRKPDDPVQEPEETATHVSWHEPEKPGEE